MDVLLVQHRRRISARSPIGDLHELDPVWPMDSILVQLDRGKLLARLRTELECIRNHEHHGSVRDPRRNGHMGLAGQRLPQNLGQPVLRRT